MTLATSPTRTVLNDTEILVNYLNATANDTTTPANGNAIDNRDMRIRTISGHMHVTDKTGTSPTAQLQLQGSNDGGTTWVPVVDSGGTNYQTSALDISTANTTAVDGLVTTNKNDIGIIPFQLLRFAVIIGGSATPGWTGKVHVAVNRRITSKVIP